VRDDPQAGQERPRSFRRTVRTGMPRPAAISAIPFSTPASSSGSRPTGGPSSWGTSVRRVPLGNRARVTIGPLTTRALASRMAGREHHQWAAGNRPGDEAGGGRETIRGEIARQQAVVERLDREREQARERLRALEASLGDDTASTVSATSPTTSAEKIALFRSLFRGRADIYPRYRE